MTPSISAGGSSGSAVDLSLAAILAPNTGTRNLIQGTGTGIPELILRAFAGQTADIFTAEDSTGTDLVRIASGGNLCTLAGMSFALKTVTANYTATKNDHVILVTSAAGSGSWSAGVTSLTPVLWYRLNENGTTTITDSGSGSHNGTLSGTYTQQVTSLLPTDTSNKATNFENAKIAVGDFYDFNGTAAFSIGFWWTPRVIDTTTRYIASKHTTDGSGLQGWRVNYSSSTGLNFNRLRDGGTDGISPATTMVVDTSYFIMYTFSGTQSRVFVNGVLDGGPLSHSRSMLDTATSLTIGKTPTDTGNGKFDLDEFMLFDYRVTDSDVQNLYNLATGAGGSGPVTITLPAASAQAGQQLIIIKEDASSGAVTINRAGSDTINGGTSVNTTTRYSGFRMFSDGVSKWYSESI